MSLSLISAHFRSEFFTAQWTPLGEAHNWILLHTHSHVLSVLYLWRILTNTEALSNRPCHRTFLLQVTGRLWRILSPGVAWPGPNWTTGIWQQKTGSFRKKRPEKEWSVRKLLWEFWVVTLRDRWKFSKTESTECWSFSHVCLFVTPWTVAYQAPPSIGFSRQEYWSGLPAPSPGDVPSPGSNLGPCIASRLFTIWATRETSQNSVAN